MVTKTARQHLEDLALLGLADRTKTGEADNAADSWAASDWLPRVLARPKKQNRNVRTDG